LKVFIDDWYIARKSNRQGLENKPYRLFYSHGGDGRVRGPLHELLGRMGSPVRETIESYRRPNDGALEACRPNPSEPERSRFVADYTTAPA
jgi:hypothetical protein